MDKIKVLVTSNREVIRGGVAQIIGSAPYLETVGSEGADVLKEAFQLQPDLLFYELSTNNDMDYEILYKLKETCNWTKLIIFSSSPIEKENIKKFLWLCNGYLQGPLLPSFLLKAVELACYSGHFFFLGSSKDIKPDTREKLQSHPGNLPARPGFLMVQRS